MLTMSRVLSFWSTKLRLDWDLPFSRVQGINIEDNGILFQDKAGKDRDRFVYISDPKSKAWFFTQIEQCVSLLSRLCTNLTDWHRVVKAYNARRNLQTK